jgi:hypothetical protein
MSNEFPPKTRDLFFWNKECWWCSRPHANCLHHTLGRISSSPLNAVPINNMECHIGNGKLSNFEVRKKLLKKTLEFLKKEEYQLTKDDKFFMKKFSQYYK